MWLHALYNVTTVVLDVYGTRKLIRTESSCCCLTLISELSIIRIQLFIFSFTSTRPVNIVENELRKYTKLTTKVIQRHLYVLNKLRLI